MLPLQCCLQLPIGQCLDSLMLLVSIMLLTVLIWSPNLLQWPYALWVENWKAKKYKIFVLSSFQENSCNIITYLVLINACRLNGQKWFCLAGSTQLWQIIHYYYNLWQVPHISGMFLFKLVGSGEPARLLSTFCGTSQSKVVHFWIFGAIFILGKGVLRLFWTTHPPW